MFKSLKAPLTAIMLSSVALVPATTVAFVASTDIAAAKSEKSGGGGGGKESSQKAKSKTAKGKSGTKSASGGSSAKRKKHGGLDGFIGKLTGKDKQKTAKAKRTSTAPKVAKVSPKERPIKDASHPSELGKMNGALNANVNALIAHVKNGNTNGPIGGMAALAVAGYAATGAQETIALYEDFERLDTLLKENGYSDLDTYLAAIEGTDPQGEVGVIEDALSETGELTLEQALLAENNGVGDFASLQEYIDYRDGTAAADPIDGIDPLIESTAGQDRPDESDIEYAEERLNDQTAAENYMLSIWNKGDGDDSVRSEAEVELLETLYDRIEADGEALSAAVEEHADLPEPPVDEEELTECVDGDATCSTEDDELAAAN